jgi:hypothetical protein
VKRRGFIDSIIENTKQRIRNAINKAINQGNLHPLEFHVDSGYKFVILILILLSGSVVNPEK